MNPPLKFPALNFHGGRVELMGKTEEACVREALAIYKAIIAARMVTAFELPDASLSELVPLASICDMYRRLGLIKFADDGEPVYERKA